MPSKAVIAIGAHPDDIEFYMAGTLLLLKKAGYEAHYLNVASGNCGSAEYNSAATRSIRNTEARAAVIRDVKPAIMLTHPPQDYMEDHTNTCRLAVTAAFARGMPNFRSSPGRPVGDYEVTVYHAMPHGLCDQLRCRVIPGAFVNTTSVHRTRREALAAHKSQQGWLDVSQGLNSYLLAMEDMSLELGRMSKRFKHAEGWRRHLHFGFCGADTDPLAKALGKNY